MFSFFISDYDQVYVRDWAPERTLTQRPYFEKFLLFSLQGEVGQIEFTGPLPYFITLRNGNSTISTSMEDLNTITDIDMLDTNHPRPFWISWNNGGQFNVGKGHVIGENEILSINNTGIPSEKIRLRYVTGTEYSLFRVPNKCKYNSSHMSSMAMCSLFFFISCWNSVS